MRDLKYTSKKLYYVFACMKSFGISLCLESPFEKTVTD